MMRFWYERAIDEQKKELREFKKKAKAQEAQTQLPQVEPVPLTVEPIGETSPEQGDQGKTAILETHKRIIGMIPGGGPRPRYMPEISFPS